MMATHKAFSKQTFIFRTYKPYSIIITTFTTILLLIFLVLAFVLQTMIGLFLAVFLLGVLIYCFRYYAVHAIIIRGATLTLRRGIIRTQEDVILLFRDSPSFQTTLLGSCFGYTTVVIRGSTGYIGLARIANATQLRELITDIQMAAPHLIDHQDVWRDSHLGHTRKRRKP